MCYQFFFRTCDIEGSKLNLSKLPKSNLTSIFGTENQTEIYSYLDKAPSPERAPNCGKLLNDNDLCKIAAKLTFTLHLGQAWKLDNTTLINKGGIWRSANEWNFIPNDDGTIYIETTSDVTKVELVSKELNHLAAILHVY